MNLTELKQDPSKLSKEELEQRMNGYLEEMLRLTDELQKSKSNGLSNDIGTPRK